MSVPRTAGSEKSAGARRAIVSADLISQFAEGGTNQLLGQE